MRKRTSVIWKMSSVEFKELVKNSNSIAEIVRHFTATLSGNYKTVRHRIKEENIDISHIRLGVDSNKGRKFPKESKPLEEVMVEHSTYCRGTLKKRLLKLGLLKNECYLCGQQPEWKGSKLVMVLDHINGVNDDHRKENLRLLCPNCNSQQKTFAGRNGKKYYYCKECNKEITKHSKTGLCLCCAPLRNSKVKNRPPIEVLLREIEDTNYSVVGRKYGVSRTSIKRWVGKRWVKQ